MPFSFPFVIGVSRINMSEVPKPSASSQAFKLAHRNTLNFLREQRGSEQQLHNQQPGTSDTDGDIDDRIYNLLIKNVTPDDPLNDEEREDLLAFRNQLSTQQWQGW